MKRFISMLACALTLCISCKKFDDSKLWDSIKALTGRVESLEELCYKMNSNIISLQAIVEACESNDGIKSIATLPNGAGYTIIFTSGKSINIYNGTNGKDGINGTDGKDGVNGTDGKDGVTPIISVRKDTDGIYYWTVNGEWLVVNGQKVKASGSDGKDGANGANGSDGKDGINGSDGKDGIDGTNGADGKDGITPKFRIEDGYWYVSYDNELSWERLGKATGNDGNSVIKAVRYDSDYVYFTLADNSEIAIPLRNAVSGSDFIHFTDPAVKVILLSNFDTNMDGEISYDEAAAVTGIGEIFRFNTDIMCFSELKYFTGLQTIDAAAFYGCENLAHVSLPNNLKYTNNYAFCSCYNLKIIDLSHTQVEEIGEGTFSGCEKLNNIKLSETLTTIGGSAFYMCGELNNIELPETLTTIGRNAFRETAIKSITLPASLMSISNMMMFPYSIEEIIFNTPSNLRVIPDGYEKFNASFYSLGIKTITLPNSIVSIGQYAFRACSSLNSVSFESNSSLTVIGRQAFENCGSQMIFDARNCEKLTLIETDALNSAVIYLCSSSEIIPQFNDGRTSLKVYAPENNIEAYRNATGWKKCTILPLSEYEE